MKQQEPIVILGAGVAGLAAGHSARMLGLPFRILEKALRPGGNCVTFSHDGFRFDSGAHRFHDRDAAATGRLRQLLGTSLRRVDVPSQIRSRETHLTFPFKIGELAAKLGWTFLLRTAGEILASRLRRRGPGSDFASRQVRNYGPTLAGMFLLNYSEKLWGLPGAGLADEIAGDRLSGLNIRAWLREMLSPPGAPAAHLEGAFLYPQGGIGAISDALADGCGRESIRTNAEAGRVLHDGKRILAVETSVGEAFPCSGVVSTIPLDRFLRLLDPPPPRDVLDAGALRFRQLALVAFFLDREAVTSAATLYFPEPRFPFTRAYEPRNRCRTMAPPGKTSLVAEIPYSAGDPIDGLGDGRLIDLARSHLAAAGLIAGRDVLDARVRRMDDAYPVLERDVAERRRVIFSYLGRLANLRAIGRNGAFRYQHIHQLLPEAEQAVAALRRG